MAIFSNTRGISRSIPYGLLFLPLLCFVCVYAECPKSKSPIAELDKFSESERLTFLEGFREGVLLAESDLRNNQHTITDFSTATPQVRAHARGHREGYNVLSKIVHEQVMDVLEELRPGSKELQKKFLDELKSKSKRAEK